MHKRTHDITGNRYGSLVVLYPVSKQREDGSAVVWRCRCDCGKETNVVQSSLVAGIKKSCGCLKEKSKLNLSEQFEMVDERRERKLRIESTGVFWKATATGKVWQSRIRNGSRGILSGLRLKRGTASS